MRKINWKILNLALWIELILCYVLPFKVIDNFEYKIGFPIPFMSVYETKIGINPLMSVSLNPLALLADGIIMYCIISFFISVYHKIKGHQVE